MKETQPALSRFSFPCDKLPSLPLYVTNTTSPHTSSNISAHMSILEQCSSASLDPPSQSGQQGDADDALPSTCYICYQALSWDMTAKEAEGPFQLTCGHIFGALCMQTWATFSSTCPMCRAEFDFDFQDNYTGTFWQDQVDSETSASSMPQIVIDEYLDILNGFTAPPSFASHSEEDLWLALAREEAVTLCPSNKRRFSVYEEGAIESDCSSKRLRHADWIPPETYHSYSTNSSDVNFDELLDSHKDWMTSAPGFEDPDDEFVVNYYDVLTRS